MKKKLKLTSLRLKKKNLAGKPSIRHFGFELRTSATKPPHTDQNIWMYLFSSCPFFPSRPSQARPSVWDFLDLISVLAAIVCRAFGATPALDICRPCVPKSRRTSDSFGCLQWHFGYIIIRISETVLYWVIIYVHYFVSACIYLQLAIFMRSQHSEAALAHQVTGKCPT